MSEEQQGKWLVPLSLSLLVRTFTLQFPLSEFVTTTTPPTLGIVILILTNFRSNTDSVYICEPVWSEKTAAAAG
jgi:hypothetical protein